MDGINEEVFLENTLLQNNDNVAPVIPFNSKYRLALADICDGLKQWRIWLLLAWQEVKLRYRRSTLGPFWITLSMAITIYTMGLLYGHLFKMDLSQYYPFLACGILGWGLISSLLTESTNIFVESEQFIKQIKQPYSLFIFKNVTRSFIIFLHHIIILVPIFIFFNVKINVYSLFFLFSLTVIWLNAVTYGVMLAILGTRFRDIVQLVNSLIQVIFFLTPIIWLPSVLPDRYQYIIQLNPFAQFMELLRNPLLGSLPSHYTLFFTLFITLLGLSAAFMLFARCRARIAYWL
ncbi:lipopolysaccharide transport system permease protein [Candidatus Rickettsiella viridis]|uniref:Transport permease protein n=1 Tax=Candidatus Rickettsiella viridis TaxID=676208 RepID=A0A2Z5UVQ2_9COXI|nr:ABC transporter permease [Candidatus Rickettsiella viridis]BBB15040.1 lipopolysaccharide transport system permease protein [Candidatus Rickettsiella viridis]